MTRFSPSGAERRLEQRHLRERERDCADDERERRELDAALLRLLLERRAALLELGDVGLVVLRDVRDVHPARVQARARDLLDTGQRLGLDRAVLREVDRRQRGQRGLRAAGAAAEHDFLDERLDVVGRDAALVARAAHAPEIDAELARELADRRARVSFAEGRRRGRDRGRTRGAARRGVGGLARGPPRCGAGPPPRGGSACRRRGGNGLCRLGGNGGSPARLQDQRSAAHHGGHGAGRTATLHLELDDLAGRGCGHVHARFLGLERDETLLRGNLVAGLHEDLDDLHFREVAEVRHHDRLGRRRGRRLAHRAIVRTRTTFGCSTVGPGHHFRLEHGLVVIGMRCWRTCDRCGRGRSRSASVPSDKITSPVETLSPTFTLSLATRPAAGDGTSIVAFSVSSVTRPCSAATSSPGLTRISMISTSAKSPRSGTTTSTARCCQKRS